MVLLSGAAVLDEAMLTGESIPVSSRAAAWTRQRAPANPRVQSDSDHWWGYSPQVRKSAWTGTAGSYDPLKHAEFTLCGCVQTPAKF